MRALWRTATCLACLMGGTIVGMLGGSLYFTVAAKSNRPRTPTVAETDPHGILCSTLRPHFDAEMLGATIIPTDAPKGCSRLVWYQMGLQGLGHRVGNWVAGQEMAVVWGASPAITADETERCGPHGCYGGAEDYLGVARDVVRLENLANNKVTHTTVRGWQRGATFREAINKAPFKPNGEVGTGQFCHTVVDLRQDLWPKSLSLGRWGLTSQLLKRAETSLSQSGRKLKPVVYEEDEIAVAVHVRYGKTSDRHKATGEAWLQTVLKQLSDIVKERTATWLHDGTRDHPTVRFHVFTGGSVFSWLKELPNVVVHGSEVDAIVTFRSLAAADVLVCGHSSLCFHAALAMPDSLALVPFNQEPFPYDMCPEELECIDQSGTLSTEQKIRFRDAIGRAMLHHTISCPALSGTIRLPAPKQTLLKSQ